MLIAIVQLLPETYAQARQMTITPGPNVNAEELGHWYSPAAVAEFIEAERNRCAKLIGDAGAYRPDGTYCDSLAEEILKGDTNGAK